MRDTQLRFDFGEYIEARKEGDYPRKGPGRIERPGQVQGGKTIARTTSRPSMTQTQAVCVPLGSPPKARK